MFKLLVFIGIVAGVCQAELTKEEKDVSTGNNLLGFNIYKELAKKPGNILFSPASAETILALTYTGAKGKTAEEMKSTLNLPDPVSTAAGYKALTQRLEKSENGVTYTSANKIYPANDIKVHPAFLKVAQESFSSDVENLDFSKGQESANTINKWVESKTNNKIKDLIKPDSLTSDTRMVLVNAVYFLGVWQHNFTLIPEKLKFHTSPTESVDTEFMFVEKHMGYAEDEDLDAQIIDIPYNDTDYSLRIILPRQVDGLSKIESQLPLDLEAQTKKLHDLNVNLKMPKFKIETTIQLVDHLKALGMKAAFGPGAELSGLSDEPLQISEVIQKAFIEVNEKGTEAAAATAVQWVYLSAVSYYPPPREILVDRPFMYFLYKKSSNTNIFIGRLQSF
ncbi:antichymotrypsin-2-like isoform X2 [Chrysoperla carnea]|uniref:antichymotrypsin-2-like isoform X2 n=1 Tax=Chrysoperla carnea TaxID=189513 RepID=UPI001D05E93C|nr:antichymotrypsin-2-like isoform X2 [Chrysoperla carnea]